MRRVQRVLQRATSREGNPPFKHRLLPSRRRGVSNELLSGTHIRIQFLTALCPFGRSFVDIRSPTWYFLYDAGFAVEASPYKGRLMKLQNVKRFLSTVQRHIDHRSAGYSVASFYPARIDTVLRDSLDAVLQSMSEEHRAFAGVAPLEEAAALRKAAESVEALIDIAVSGNPGTSNESPAFQYTTLQTTSYCTSFAAFTAACPWLVPTDAAVDSATSDATQPSTGTFALPPPVRRAVYEAVLQSLTAQAVECRATASSVAASAIRVDPLTHILVMADHRGSSEVLHSVFCALGSAQFSSPKRSEDASTWDAMEALPVPSGEATPDHSAIVEPTTLAFCHLQLSVGVIELDDLTCSLVRLVRCPKQMGHVVLHLEEEGVPLLELHRQRCDAVVVHNAELLSHKALQALRARLEQNALHVSVCGTQKTSSADGGLLPKWTPTNGGLCIVCVGVADTTQRLDVPTWGDTDTVLSPSGVPVKRKPFCLTIASSAAGSVCTHNTARETYRRLMDTLLTASTDAAAVTSVHYAPELSTRESMVQSFLRSTRPISFQSVVALLASCPDGAGTSLLPFQQNYAIADVAAGELCTREKATSTVGKAAITRTLQEIVRELNHIKLLCEAAHSNGVAMARLEHLMEEVPLLKYIGVCHTSLVRFHNLSHLDLSHLDLGSADGNTLLLEVERRVRWANTHRDGSTDGCIGKSGATELVRSRSAERQGSDLLLCSLLSTQPPGSGTRYASVLFPPRPAQGHRGVTAIACVHAATPLSVVEEAVFQTIVQELAPPGFDLEDCYTHCVAFPLDYVRFQGKGSVRRCIGIRLVLRPDTADDPSAIEDAKALLSQALVTIRAKGAPFAVEAVPHNVFTAASKEIKGDAEVVAQQASTDGHAQHAAVMALLEQFHQASASAPTTAIEAFATVDELSVLMYPNVVERRLQALAATAVPDATFCRGMHVMVNCGANVWVIGTVYRDFVEQQLDDSARVVCRIASATFATIDGFLWASDVVRDLHHVVGSGVTGGGVAAVAAYFIEQQGLSDEGHAKLPVLRIPSKDVSWSHGGGSTEHADMPTHVHGVLLPACCALGRRRSLYGYELPVVTMPMVPASHCGLDYRVDGLYSASSGTLLHTLAAKDPFVDLLSMRLSRAVFREPILSWGAANTAAMVRLAVSKAANVHLQQADQDEAVRDEADGDSDAGVLDRIDRFLCTSAAFTEEVFF